MWVKKKQPSYTVKFHLLVTILITIHRFFTLLYSASQTVSCYVIIINDVFRSTMMHGATVYFKIMYQDLLKWLSLMRFKLGTSWMWRRHV